MRETVEREVSRWEGVETRPHRFGGIEFRVQGYEIGHLHGSRMADLPFPVRVRKELVAEGKAEPHHILPQTGWISYYANGTDDARTIINLFRLNYERLVQVGRDREAPARGVV